jgi:hypothetical protein
VTSNPTRCVEVTVEAEFLLVWYKIRVTGIHILGRRRDLLFVKRCIKIRWIA